MSIYLLIREEVFLVKSPFTFTHTAPTEGVWKATSYFFVAWNGSNEEDLPQLVQDFKGSHHIFSLRGPIVFDPGYAFFTIEEEGKPIRAEFDEVLTYYSILYSRGDCGIWA